MKSHLVVSAVFFLRKNVLFKGSCTFHSHAWVLRVLPVTAAHTLAASVFRNPLGDLDGDSQLQEVPLSHGNGCTCMKSNNASSTTTEQLSSLLQPRKQLEHCHPDSPRGAGNIYPEIPTATQGRPSKTQLEEELFSQQPCVDTISNAVVD